MAVRAKPKKRNYIQRIVLSRYNLHTYPDDKPLWRWRDQGDSPVRKICANSRPPDIYSDRMADTAARCACRDGWAFPISKLLVLFAMSDHEIDGWSVSHRIGWSRTLFFAQMKSEKCIENYQVNLWSPDTGIRWVIDFVLYYDLLRVSLNYIFFYYLRFHFLHLIFLFLLFFFILFILINFCLPGPIDSLKGADISELKILSNGFMGFLEGTSHPNNESIMVKQEWMA